MKKVKQPKASISGNKGKASKQDADRVPTLTKNKSRYEFSSKITGSDTGKIDPSKHTDKQ